MTVPDARELNWRFVAPHEPAGMVVLDRSAADRHRSLADALAGAPWPAIAVPDLTAWTTTARPLTVLRQVAAAVAPGGWLCVGFPNRWFPRRARGAVGLGAARRALHAAGLAPTQVYLPLPDHRRPALVVDAGHRGQLDYVFRHVFLTYLPGDSTGVRIGRRALVGVRRAATVTPHPVRVRLAPGYLLIARRSP